MDHQKGNQALMKKLTAERLQTVEQAIIDAQISAAKREQEKPATVTARWLELMNIYWKAEGIIMDNLGCSMSRAISLIQSKTVISDYYDMATGRPKKGGN